MYEAVMQRGEFGDCFEIGIFETIENAKKAIEDDKNHLTEKEKKKAKYFIYETEKE